MDLTAFATLVPDAGIGPLGGICAGLAAAVEDLAVFLPVDMPLIPPGLLRLMLQHARTTGRRQRSPRSTDLRRPFRLFWTALCPLDFKTSSGTEMEAALLRSRAACQESGSRLTVLPVEFLVQARQIMDEDGLPAALWFLNVNTPADLERAESIVAARRRVC